MIAEVLYLTNDIEKYGNGYTRIRKAIAEYPTMNFTYKEIANGYLAEFSYSVQKTTVNPENVTVNPENGTVNPYKGKSEKFEKRRKVVLDAIQQAPASTVTELSKALKISVRTLKRDIDYLKESGQIIRDGSDKTGHWKVL